MKKRIFYDDNLSEELLKKMDEVIPEGADLNSVFVAVLSFLLAIIREAGEAAPVYSETAERLLHDSFNSDPITRLAFTLPDNVDA